jgi:hypothetical protein
LLYGDSLKKTCRTVDTEQCEASYQNTMQKLKRTIALFLSNISGETKELEVVERSSVRELEDVEVQTREEESFCIDKDGLAKQHRRQHANETKQLRSVYEVRASSKVRMPLSGIRCNERR